ncbi:MAG: diguanylate cyclase [Pseudomonadota bacterium]
MNDELEQQVTERTEALAQANKTLEKLSNEDGLTGLYNRRYFDESLEREWLRLQRSRASISLIMCDIDHFKEFNDTYGHQAGDTCLQQVAQVIRANAKRPYDVAARYGGEEFGIILPQTSIRDAQRIAEDIQKEIRLLAVPHQNSPIRQTVSMSFGVASLIPNHSSSSKHLVAIADAALYRSKKQGRDRVSVKVAEGEKRPKPLTPRTS